MFGFKKENRRRYTDVATVQSQRNDLAAEEFPEGPYGSDMQSETLGRSEPWREDQHTAMPFGYENKELHEGIDRDYPGSDHELRDDESGGQAETP
ncbi:MAG: hypothetical protein J7639_26690 [Paenibacillaceae bacterium]|nr:hypothetical protein [Paenibacillaceae bacterium]